MNNFMQKISNFIRREKVYLFLLIFALFIHTSFMLLEQILESGGLDKVFMEESQEDKEIISEERLREIAASNPAISVLFLILFLGFILFIVIGIAVDIVYLIFKNKEPPPFIKSRIVEGGFWNFWDIGKVAIIFLFAQSILLLVNVFFLSGIPYLQVRSGLRIMLSATLIDVVAIAAILYFVLKERKQDIGSLGLTKKHIFSNIRYGLFSYIGLIPILAGVMFLSMALFKLFNIPIEPQPILFILKEEKHLPSLLYMGFFTAILGPVLEEIFFRGFAYSVFKKKLGIFGGIALSALFFAYVHANLASFFPILALGILLAYLYEKTGSLVPSITVHIIHNSVTLGFLLFVKAISE